MDITTIAANAVSAGIATAAARPINTGLEQINENILTAKVQAQQQAAQERVHASIPKEELYMQNHPAQNSSTFTRVNHPATRPDQKLESPRKQLSLKETLELEEARQLAVAGVPDPRIDIKAWEQKVANGISERLLRYQQSQNPTASKWARNFSKGSEGVFINGMEQKLHPQELATAKIINLVEAYTHPTAWAKSQWNGIKQEYQSLRHGDASAWGRGATEAGLLFLAPGVTKSADRFGMWMTPKKLGDIYSKDFVGPVQWEYFYRGDSTFRTEFLSSMTQLKGTRGINNFLDKLQTETLKDIYAEHSISNSLSPFISTSKNHAVAKYFAEGLNQTQSGYITTFRVEAREAMNLQGQGKIVPNFENPMSFFETNPNINLPESEYLFRDRIDSRYIYNTLGVK